MEPEVLCVCMKMTCDACTERWLRECIVCGEFFMYRNGRFGRCGRYECRQSAAGITPITDDELICLQESVRATLRNVPHIWPVSHAN